MYLLRAIGESGKLISFERREDFAEIAKANLSAALGYKPTNWRVLVGSLQDELEKEIEPGSVDRVVLDMLAPWECIKAVSSALAPGGVLICYVATVTQLSRVAEEIRTSGSFTEPAPFETLFRGWHLQGLAVRPEHRMGGHTGFILTCRKLAPDTLLPNFNRRAKPEFDAEDVAIWNAESPIEAPVSDKKVRKSLRKAQLFATSSLSDELDDAE
jgi:tRNA (adenine57-N1/adenine58-N1)-methyltransferase